MKSGAPKTREEDLCQNLLKIEVRRPKTLAPLLLCKRFTLPDSATPKATHTHTFGQTETATGVREQQRQQQREEIRAEVVHGQQQQ